LIQILEALERIPERFESISVPQDFCDTKAGREHLDSICDEQFDIATDIFLEAVSIDDVQTPLAPGESYTITEAVTIPSTAADSQFLLFVTDENNDELETSKSNNVFAEAVQFPTGLIVNLDVDNNGQTDALTDGSLIRRYLFEHLAWDNQSGEAGELDSEYLYTLDGQSLRTCELRCLGCGQNPSI